MCKKSLLLIAAFGFASSLWAQPVPPYVGQVAGTWSTVSAVTATAGSTGDPVFGAGSDPGYVNWGPQNTVNAGGLGDEWHHSYAVTGTGWFGNQTGPSGLAHPSGRSVAGYSQNWISFAFDKAYDLESFDIWNGSYSGPTGEFGPGDWALGSVYLDYKVGGTWQMAASTIDLNRLPTDYSWFTPTDRIAVNLNGVEEVCITPTQSYGNLHHGQFSGNAVLSEIRFYTVVPEPSSLALIGVGALALLLRRKS